MPEQLVDPVVLPTEGTLIAAPGLPRLSGQRLAMLDNTKAGTDELLLRLGRALEQQFGCEFELLRKPDPGIAPEAIFRDVSARFQGIVTGLGDCGSCSSCSVHDAALWEAVGIPTVVVATEPFLATAEATADLLGFSGLRIVYAPHPVSRLDGPGFDRLAAALLADVGQLLLESA